MKLVIEETGINGEKIVKRVKWGGEQVWTSAFFLQIILEKGLLRKSGRGPNPSKPDGIKA